MDLTGIGSIAELASGLISRFFPPSMSEGEKAKVQIELQAMLEKRENAVIEAQKSIIVAEMNQGDAYTKRARPTLVYAGLGFIFLVHVVFPMLAWAKGGTLPTLALPEEFWWAWSGVCGIWVIGRSAEKRGSANRLVGMITGATKLGS